MYPNTFLEFGRTSQSEFPSCHFLLEAKKLRLPQSACLVALTNHFNGYSGKCAVSPTPLLPPRLLNGTRVDALRCSITRKCFTLSPRPAFASVASSGPAVCSCLSPARCYKLSVICSVKCRPQTEGQPKARQQRHPVPPGLVAHRKRGSAGLSVWPRSLPGSATQPLMQGDTQANCSLISPSDLRKIPLTLENQTEDLFGVICFVLSSRSCLIPPHSSSSSLLPAKLEAAKLGI